MFGKTHYQDRPDVSRADLQILAFKQSKGEPAFERHRTDEKTGDEGQVTVGRRAVLR